jgi:hypothetical protein
LSVGKTGVFDHCEKLGQAPGLSETTP